MKLTIFAATGGIGRQLLQQAVAAGHDVTAVVRDPARLAADLAAIASMPAVTAAPSAAGVPGAGGVPGAARAGGAAVPGVAVVAADLAAPDPAVLESAVAGAGAVLSGLGPRSPSADAGITCRGTAAIIAAMRAAGTRRLLVVSAAPVGTVASPDRPRPPRHDPGDGPAMRYLMSPLIKMLLRKHYADLALMEDALARSGLDWTSIRPPRLTDKPLTGSYRTAYGRNLRGGLTISRADVAHLMLHLIGEPASFGQTAGVAY